MIGATRGFSVIPEQFSVWSSVVKYFVPNQLEMMVHNVSVVLGARFYVREEHDWGIFQKMLRDNAVISMFDGSSIVNLHALILQLRHLSKYRAKIEGTKREALRSRLEVIFSVHQPLPNFDPQKLELFGRGVDDSLQGLEIARQQLEDLQGKAEVEAEVLEHLLSLSGMVLEELNLHDYKLVHSKFEFGHHQSPELFAIAKRYCTLHAAASCLHLWLYNRNSLGEFFARGEWLVLSLHRLLGQFRPLPYCISEVYSENVAQQLLTLYQENQLFSLIPMPLAQSQTPTQEDQNHANRELQLQN